MVRERKREREGSQSHLIPGHLLGSLMSLSCTINPTRPRRRVNPINSNFSLIPCYPSLKTKVLTLYISNIMTSVLGLLTGLSFSRPIVPLWVFYRVPLCKSTPYLFPIFWETFVVFFVVVVFHHMLPSHILNRTPRLIKN